MTTNIKEMSFSELNTQMETLKLQIEELSSEIQTRKEQVMENYRLHLSQMLEDYRLLVEMGMDPATISMEATSIVEEQVEEPAAITNDEVVEEEPEEVIEEVVEEVVEEVIPSEPKTTGHVEVEHTDTTSSPTTEISEAGVIELLRGVDWEERKRGMSSLIIPYYYMLELRKGAYPTVCDGKFKRRTTELLTSAEVLLKDHINQSLNMGNLKYRDSYPNPDEGRIYSADGIAPTLTATHSNLLVWIPNREHSKGHTSSIPISTAA